MLYETLFTVVVFLLITAGTAAGLYGLFWVCIYIDEKMGKKSR